MFLDLMRCRLCPTLNLHGLVRSSSWSICTPSQKITNLTCESSPIPGHISQAEYQGIRMDSKPAKRLNSRSISIANTGLESPRGILYRSSLKNQAFTQASNPLGDNKSVMMKATEITTSSYSNSLS